MTKIIDAIQMCDDRMEQYQKDTAQIAEILGHKPQFVIINASDNEANKRYIKGKVKEGERAGLDVKVVTYTEDCDEDVIIDNILYLQENKIPVIVQLPMYDHLNRDRILSYIDWTIDADGFTKEWIGNVNLGIDDLVVPATPKGVIDLLEYHNVDIVGKNVLIIGSSNHVGKPIIPLILKRGGTILNANINTQDLPSLVRIADIIISCVGKINLINPDDIKDNSVLIGVGFTYVERKQILDFDVDKIVEDGRASIVSNRINCTGKATIISLIDNVIMLYKMNLNLI